MALYQHLTTISPEPSLTNTLKGDSYAPLDSVSKKSGDRYLH